MYGRERRLGKRIRSFFRYHFYMQRYKAEMREFVQYLQQHPQWLPVFEQNGYRFNALLAKFCDRRFSVRQRLSVMKYAFDCAEQCWGSENCRRLVAQQSLLLAQLTENWGVYLNINAIDPFEGFFSLNIKNREGRSVYDASFTFLPENRILIASVQGPNGAEAQELVKTATKQLHGMRPMYMIVHVFRTLADVLAYELLGIAHKNQAKFRWNDHSKLLFNYDEFWRENEGALDEEGYWRLPLEVERKPLEEIQSKKRSMYRKRYDMFDSIQRSVRDFFHK
ncbi:DUF535 domain-containing protein [Actinobacillus succinogenes]|uniref:DUF535 domain-containing protein n=1 Tax=Actinobacillus succinogenes (strain ATCC 55618 / DSM 22257 / CCUG 43843 / 130Z) TaxID=339671 RepID=A6VPL1_ACTSZ|nr:VirK/YbjX family protein [Actinobacillus succinogenes]ABR74908.1 protein of unknown function DUF535 [Actinobacillus succinogenes 130Z]PHI40680.1 DUF535 domain-containing protein [Actinobacillus succinogenes]